jgi:rod shape determining protein RodA
MQIKQTLRSFPWFFMGLVVLLALEGTALLYSSAHGDWEPWAIRHIVRFGLLFAAAIAVALIPVRFIYRFAYLAYAGALGLLLLNAVWGDVAMGAARWLDIGPVRIQPSDPMKLALILALARYFHDFETAASGRLVLLVPPLLMIFIPTAMILVQPDLGTGAILAMCGLMMVFVAGISWRRIAVAAVLGLAALPLLWKFYLKDYQKQRVMVFLDPEADPLGSGYNILQSIIAIGSGGMTGKGFLKGTQGQLEFLPEHQTDFIFTVLAEEYGFLGCAATLALYGILILRALSIGSGCAYRFGSLLAAGVASLLFTHVAVNVSMVTGIIPVVGAPLPLLSYGGTIMMTMMAAFGLLANVKAHADNF